MPDYDMHTGVPHEPRTCDFQGFDNVDDTNITASEKPTVPYEKPAPLVNAVTQTSNTQRVDVGPSAHDITMRTRNG
jgi:hypothetical protein